MTHIVPFMSGVINHAIPDHSPIVLPSVRPTLKRNRAFYRAALSVHHLIQQEAYSTWLEMLSCQVLPPRLLMNVALDCCGSPYHLGACTQAAHLVEGYEDYERLREYMECFAPLHFAHTLPAHPRFTHDPARVMESVHLEVNFHMSILHSDCTATLYIQTHANDLTIPYLLNEWWQDHAHAPILLCPPYVAPDMPSLTYAVHLLVVDGVQ